MTPGFKRVCSECGGILKTDNPKAKTCGDICRAKRSRRLRNLSKSRLAAAHDVADNQPHQAEIANAVRHQAPDIAHKLIQAELVPIVREALTDDVLRAIHQLVGLTPTAVRMLEEDLENPVASIRQKAYSLLLRYTVGHPAIVQAEEDAGGKQLIVNFQMPRPAGPAAQELDMPEIEVTEAEELGECDICHGEFPLSQFVANSDRCETCFGALQDRVKDLLTGPEVKDAN